VAIDTNMDDAYYHSAGITPRQILADENPPEGSGVLTSALETRVASQ